MMMGYSGHCGGVHNFPAICSVSPEHLYCEVTPRAKARSRLVLPFPDPSQVGSRGMINIQRRYGDPDNHASSLPLFSIGPG